MASLPGEDAANAGFNGVVRDGGIALSFGSDVSLLDDFPDDLVLEFVKVGDGSDEFGETNVGYDCAPGATENPHS